LTIQITSDHELKKAQRELAEVQLATVNAELMLQEAQHIESDLSSLNKAETAFELAREAEEKAEAAVDPIANETAARNSWCEALKRAFETTVVTNDLRENPPSLSLLSPSSSCATNWNDVLQETQDTEHAWNEVVDTCNSALDNKPTRALKKAWEKDLEEAVNQHALWQLRVLWWKAMKTAESVKASNIPQDTALQQVEAICSVYDEMIETGHKQQNEAPERLKFWWSHDLQQIEAQRIAHKKELTRLQEAETRRKAKAETERIAAEEALEQEEQERAAKKEADRIAQENAEAKKRAEARASQEFKADIERAREAERAEWTWNGWALAEVDRIAEDINTSWIDWEPTRAAAAQRSYRLIHGVGTQTATFVQRTFPVVTNAAITSVSNLITWASQVVRRVWGEGVERQVIVKEVEAANPQVQRINEARAKAAKATESAQECQEKGKTAREASKGWVIYLFNPSNIEVKEKEAKYWEEAAACLRDASRSWSEVEKELTQGNQRRAASWSDAGTQYEKAAKLYYSAANNPAANLQGNIKISGEALRTNAEEYERKARNL
ncbi:MAG TPA: hypothetical protein VJK54_04280, partial [Chthoniobacterales bacterium]|nr:hypothetical protein [Chthoniobacterales bacterium]